MTVAELDKRSLIIYRRFQQLLQEVFQECQLPEAACAWLRNSAGVI